jgi:hypothetical protein
MPEEPPSARPEEDQGQIPAPVKTGYGMELFKAKDPQGFEISLGVETWETHILARHPEMADLLDMVMKTVLEPEVIQQSPRQPTTYYYYRLSGRKIFRRDDLFAMVIVNRDNESKTGFVKTAHLVDKLKGAENIVWFNRTS